MPKGYPLNFRHSADTDAVVAAALARLEARGPRPRSGSGSVTIEHRREPGWIRAYTAPPSRTPLMERVDRAPP